jgi:alginate O-acetyltransferase complex protein AlgI
MLLAVSLGMYAWFQPTNVVEVVGIILLNYALLSQYQKGLAGGKPVRGLFFTIIGINILIFVGYRVLTTPNLIQAYLSSHPQFPFMKQISYPIGLSFITFQILSCLFETDRAPQNFPPSVWDYLLYLLYFSKILEGPITRWPQFIDQVNKPTFTTDRLVNGSKRFIVGFAKKTLIADQLAVIVNAGFNLPYPAFNTPLAWLLLLSFCIQIYFDFSGYIDMVLGISLMLGMEIPENFNHPYRSLNITEFWRRWHISLSSWFRDYVFMPLEFARRHIPYYRQEFNVLIIFALTGLWHGFTWNFLLWGIAQGIFIIFESSKPGKWFKKAPVVIQRIYFWGALLFSWVLFRSPTFQYMVWFIKRLFVFTLHIDPLPFSQTKPLPIINPSVYLALIIGVICLFPVGDWLQKYAGQFVSRHTVFRYLHSILLIGLFILSVSIAVSQSFIPSIYGKF